MFRQVDRSRVPDWAAATGYDTWTRFFVAWILGHPAVTCIIPATRNPEHAAANLAAASAPLPDEAMRRRMAAHFASL